MSLIEEIKGNFNFDEIVCPYKLTLFADNKVYIEGVKNIKVYEREKIILTVKNGELTISGKNLEFIKFCLGDVAICGKIDQISKT